MLMNLRHAIRFEGDKGDTQAARPPARPAGRGATVLPVAPGWNDAQPSHAQEEWLALAAQVVKGDTDAAAADHPAMVNPNATELRAVLAATTGRFKPKNA